MTAWIEAVSDAVIALTALGAIAAWMWHTRRRYAIWRKRKRRDEILGYAVPACVITLFLAAMIKGSGQ